MTGWRTHESEFKIVAKPKNIGFCVAQVETVNRARRSSAKRIFLLFALCMVGSWTAYDVDCSVIYARQNNDFLMRTTQLSCCRAMLWHCFLGCILSAFNSIIYGSHLFFFCPFDCCDAGECGRRIGNCKWKL